MFGTSTRGTQTPPTRSTSVVITVVQTSGCHFCVQAEESLEVLAARYPIHVSLVDVESPEGVRLTQQHRPAMNPLVLVDGRFFSSGRLPRKKLTALLGRVAGDSAHPKGS